jgi:hypothetical protein
LDRAVPPTEPIPVAIPYPIPLLSLESPPNWLMPCPIKFPVIPAPVPANEEPIFWLSPSVKALPLNALSIIVLEAEVIPELNTFPKFYPNAVSPNSLERAADNWFNKASALTAAID